MGKASENDKSLSKQEPLKRNTAQRQAIRQVFIDTRRPLSPTEALDKAAKLKKGIGIATIYRAVRDLVDEGWLRPVEIPGQPPRYELMDLPHHHHFHCHGCGRTFDIHHCPGELMDIAPKDFLVESHHLTLLGLCADCRK